MSVLLAAVAALEPASYTDIEAYMAPMCERLVGSHLKRLHGRGLIEYNAGAYTLTEEGRAILDGTGNLRNSRHDSGGIRALQTRIRKYGRKSMPVRGVE